MTFLVSLETPGLGSRVFCFLEAQDKRLAQKQVVEALVLAGISIDTIGQVCDWVTLEIGIHKISVVPVKRMNAEIVSAMTALL